MTELDPSRPIAPVGAAGPSRRAGGCRPGPDRPRPGRSGSSWAPGSAGWPTTWSIRSCIPFADLPGWPAATAPGHVGRLLLGRLDGTPVAMLQGRLHMYEGNDAGLVVQPVLLMGRLGARLVVLTNAAGGLDPTFGPGTLMIIDDHINLTGRTPLLGPNADDDRTSVHRPDRRLEPTPARAPARGVPGRGRRLRRRRLRRPARSDLRDPGRGPDAPVVRRRRGRDVDGARGDRRPLGGPRGLRRVARDERRRRLHRCAADPRGGPRVRGRGRPAAGPGHPPVRRRPRGRPEPRQRTDSSRPASRAALALSAQAPRTVSLCGRIGQCSSRLPISSQ